MLLSPHDPTWLMRLQVSSGAWQQLKENLALAKTKKPQELGVDGAVPPDPLAVEKIRHKFLRMRKVYSPEKKVSLLLRVCKLIYTIMQDNSGEHVAETVRRWLQREGTMVSASIKLSTTPADLSAPPVPPSRQDVRC